MRTDLRARWSDFVTSSPRVAPASEQTDEAQAITMPCHRAVEVINEEQPSPPRTRTNC